MAADEHFYWHWITGLENIGRQKIKYLLSHVGTPKDIYNIISDCGNEGARDRLEEIRSQYADRGMNSIITEEDIDNLLSEKLKMLALDRYNRFVEAGIRITTIASEDYPDRLKDIFDAPYILYYRGELPDNNRKAVAIVGTRTCSDYGRHVTKQISGELAAKGIEIVSGFARGTDTAAHNGCLEAGGKTIAVFGSGIERCYPKENKFTYDDIIEHGGAVISEFDPYTPPAPGLFPLRNRIISGLSEAVIVVEAALKSGSLITADLALEQNRIVMAVPGRITDRMSAGTNNLIKQGAAIVTCAEDVLYELGMSEDVYIGQLSNIYDNRKNILNDNFEENKLANEEKMLYSQLDFNPQHIDELISKSGMMQEEVLSILVKLELLGLVSESGGFYSRR